MEPGVAMGEGRRESRWTWLLAGVLLGSAVSRWCPAAPTGPAVERCTLVLPPAPEAPRRTGSPGPRELRGLDGVGLRRSLVLSRALWEDPTLALDPTRLRGIGPVTAAPLVEHLSTRPPR